MLIQAGPVFWTRQTHGLSNNRVATVQGSNRDSDATNVTNRQFLDPTGTKSAGDVAHLAAEGVVGPVHELESAGAATNDDNAWFMRGVGHHGPHFTTESLQG